MRVNGRKAAQHRFQKGLRSVEFRVARGEHIQPTEIASKSGLDFLDAWYEMQRK